MYIALRWLFGLATFMWIGLCVSDIYGKRIKENDSDLLYDTGYKNISIQMERSSQIHLERIKHENGSEQSGMAMLHCALFLAGAFAVSVFNNKNKILIFAKTKISKIHFRILTDKICTANQLIITYIIVAVHYAWKNIIIFAMKIKTVYNVMKRKNESKHEKINCMLLNKLKEIGEERKSLGQLLMSAIHENKTIRMQYQLQKMAKNRLLQYIDDTQMKVKENRTRYLSFQHLYLIIYQENVFLKARIGKLTREKEEVEKKFLGVINEVYRSKNKELKLYCSRLIVQTKDNFLNSDVSAEIRNFLRSKQRSKPNSSKCQISDEKSTANHWPKCTSTHETGALREDGRMIPLATDAPRLKGLPGEYVWTVKDKNGVIEKLFELDYESHLDNGDTIRRIRQYSVYFDKDCLLDYSKTVIYETNTREPSSQYNVDYPIAQGKLVTGSEAFQKFLRDNKNVPLSTRRPSLICG